MAVKLSVGGTQITMGDDVLWQVPSTKERLLLKDDAEVAYDVYLATATNQPNHNAFTLWYWDGTTWATLTANSSNLTASTGLTPAELIPRLNGSGSILVDVTFTITAPIGADGSVGFRVRCYGTAARGYRETSCRATGRYSGLSYAWGNTGATNPAGSQVMLTFNPSDPNGLATEPVAGYRTIR